jgi:hypothetical protein
MNRYQLLLTLALAGLIGAMACGGGGPTAPDIMNRDPGATPPPGSTITPRPAPTPQPCQGVPWKNQQCPDN